MLDKVKEVFTKEYREETEYREFMKSNVDFFKLKNKSESIDEKVARLSRINFVSEFNIEVEKF